MSIITVENVNHDNWTGETSSIEFNTEARTFNFYDYKFTLGELVTVESVASLGDCGYLKLMGDGWGDEPLTTIHLLDGTSLEEQIKKSVAWIANHV
ncbi:hypothetical protein VCHA53O466_140117 [Vibrio chagasii]|nr:hypothetical protein VCHA53O466_140117 [Vibrio chagasii]